MKKNVYSMAMNEAMVSVFGYNKGHMKEMSIKTAKQIFEELETFFLIGEGDSFANFHTFLIKDYEKIKAKFLQEKT